MYELSVMVYLARKVRVLLLCALENNLSDKSAPTASHLILLHRHL
jgi:hypothetical protein